MIPLFVFSVHEADASAADDGISIQFLDVSQGEVIHLDIGETRIFRVRVESDQTFINALMLSDEQFPGKGIRLSGADIATRAAEAELSLAATGKSSTADLPGGVAPVSFVVGVRYPGRLVQSQRVSFLVSVP